MQLNPRQTVRLALPLVAAMAMGLTLPASAASPAYTVLGADTQVFGLNNLGMAAGFQNIGGGSTAFVWQNGSFSYLTGPATALGSAAMDISDAGVVVGTYFDTLVTDPTTGEVTAGPNKAYIYNGAQYTTFTVATDATATQLRGISPNGRYVSGYYETASVAGIGFVHDTISGNTVTLTSASSLLTIAQGVNNLGQVVGSDISLTGPNNALLRNAFTYDFNTGTRTDYSFSGYTRTAFRDINASGQLAGWLQRTDPTLGKTVTEGFLGSTADFDVFTVPGSTEAFVQALNDQGSFAGYYTLNGVQYAFVSSPVPEAPAAWLLAAGLAAWRRRAAR